MKALPPSTGWWSWYRAEQSEKCLGTVSRKQSSCTVFYLFETFNRKQPWHEAGNWSFRCWKAIGVVSTQHFAGSTHDSSRLAAKCAFRKQIATKSMSLLPCASSFTSLDPNHMVQYQHCFTYNAPVCHSLCSSRFFWLAFPSAGPKQMTAASAKPSLLLGWISSAARKAAQHWASPPPNTLQVLKKIAQQEGWRNLFATHIATVLIIPSHSLVTEKHLYTHAKSRTAKWIYKHPKGQNIQAAVAVFTWAQTFPHANAHVHRHPYTHSLHIQRTLFFLLFLICMLWKMCVSAGLVTCKCLCGC